MDAARDDQGSSSPTPANSKRPPRPNPPATMPTSIGSSTDDYVALWFASHKATCINVRDCRATTHPHRHGLEPATLHLCFLLRERLLRPTPWLAASPPSSRDCHNNAFILRLKLRLVAGIVAGDWLSSFLWPFNLLLPLLSILYFNVGFYSCDWFGVIMIGEWRHWMIMEKSGDGDDG